MDDALRLREGFIVSGSFTNPRQQKASLSNHRDPPPHPRPSCCATTKFLSNMDRHGRQAGGMNQQARMRSRVDVPPCSRVSAPKRQNPIQYAARYSPLRVPCDGRQHTLTWELISNAVGRVLAGMAGILIVSRPERELRGPRRGVMVEAPGLTWGRHCLRCARALPRPSPLRLRIRRMESSIPCGAARAHAA